MEVNRNNFNFIFWITDWISLICVDAFWLAVEGYFMKFDAKWWGFVINLEFPNDISNSKWRWKNSWRYYEWIHLTSLRTGNDNRKSDTKTFPFLLQFPHLGLLLLLLCGDWLHLKIKTRTGRIPKNRFSGIKINLAKGIKLPFNLPTIPIEWKKR